MLMSGKPNRMHHGQPYWLVGHEDVTRRDGEAATLDVYRTFCAECGEPFHAKVSQGANKYLNRRCEAHRKPGVKV